MRNLRYASPLSGTIQMEVEDGLTAEQKDAGYVLPCVGRTEGTVVVAASFGSPPRIETDSPANQEEQSK